MKLCIGNLSFKKKRFVDYCDIVEKLKCTRIELAPSLISIKIEELKKIIKKRKIKIESIQSVFFKYNSKKYLKFMEKNFIDCFKKTAFFAKKVSAKNICIGNCPSRSLNLNNKKLMNLNLKYFKIFSKISKKYKIRLLIEPLHKKFNINFLNNHLETYKFISNFDNMYLLFDTGNIKENNENFSKEFLNYKEKIRHVHFRNENKNSIKKKINFLRKNKYKHSYSIEIFENYGKKCLNLLGNIK